MKKYSCLFFSKERNITSLNHINISLKTHILNIGFNNRSNPLISLRGKTGIGQLFVAGEEVTYYDKLYELVEEWTERRNTVHYGVELDVRILKKWEFISLVENQIIINSKN